MSTIDDLYSQLGKACDSINVAIGKFAAQIPAANDQQRLQIRNKIHYLGDEAIEFRAAFLNAAIDDNVLKGAMKSIGSLTDQIDEEVKYIADLASALNSISKVIGYVAQVASIVGPLLA